MAVRIGVIGCGKIGERHINAYRKIGGVEVIISDIDYAVSKRIADKYRLEWATPDEILNNDKIDAVDICVPTVHHKKFIDAAIEYGKHFFCEKPLVASLKDVKNVSFAKMDIVLNEREIEGKNIAVDAEDSVLVELETVKCKRVICESDLLTPSYMNYIEIQGTNGSVWASILDYFPTIVYCKEATGIYNQGNNFFNFHRVDLFERELRYFVETIKKGEAPNLNSINESIKMLEIIEEIRRLSKW